MSGEKESDKKRITENFEARRKPSVRERKKGEKGREKDEREKGESEQMTGQVSREKGGGRGENVAPSDRNSSKPRYFPPPVFGLLSSL